MLVDSNWKYAGYTQIIMGFSRVSRISISVCMSNSKLFGWLNGSHTRCSDPASQPKNCTCHVCLLPYAYGIKRCGSLPKHTQRFCVGQIQNIHFAGCLHAARCAYGLNTHPKSVMLCAASACALTQIGESIRGSFKKRWAQIPIKVRELFENADATWELHLELKSPPGFL